MSTYVFATGAHSAAIHFAERGQQMPSNTILIRSVEDAQGRIITPSTDKVVWADFSPALDDAFFVLTCHLGAEQRTQLRLGE